LIFAQDFECFEPKELGSFEQEIEESLGEPGADQPYDNVDDRLEQFDVYGNVTDFVVHKSIQQVASDIHVARVERPATVGRGREPCTPES